VNKFGTLRQNCSREPARSSSVIDDRALALSFDGAALRFGIEPPTLRAARWLGRSPMRGHVQRTTQPVDQARLGNASVPELGTFIVDHHADLRPKPFDYSSTLYLVTKRRRRLDIEHQLDSCRSLVRVLAARPTRGTERHREFVAGDANRVRHDETIVSCGLATAHVTIIADRRTEAGDGL
jgi:hypothetical protein